LGWTGPLRIESQPFFDLEPVRIFLLIDVKVSINASLLGGVSRLVALVHAASWHVSSTAGGA
jgi:hypothetical protein